ncbi:MAG TPA: glycosyltransferase family 2 protein [Vicinamibacterales bacterium]|nr:glycosyltransferase family 2 protein [Vicinamibacterales bacterium]
MKAVFWISAFVVAYVYVGYPALLAIWARLSRRARRGEAAPGGADRPWPAVSIVVAVRNEAARLPARIENLLALDYPAGLLEMIVVSNGSTDGTAAVLERYASRVRAIVLGRSGKATAINAGVAAARHEMVVFADARQQFAPDALKRLVARFDDPAIGAVSGELVIDAEESGAAAGASSVGEGVGLYWRYEKWIRRHESDVWSVVGATGAIYALRRSLWTALPEETVLDDVLAPMRIVLDGYRVVFEPGARAFDVVSPDARTEERRKVRTLAGNFQLLWLEPRLLWPIANPIWLQFVSHKVGRLVVPYALVALLLSSMALASTGPVYALALVAQVGFYVLAAHGAIVAIEEGRAPAAAARPSPVPVPAPVRKRRREELVNAQVD